jgi:hypothetical protein
MNKIRSVEPYRASIGKEILGKWSGVVRVWSEPKSAVDGATVVDEIKKPTRVTVLEEQLDVYGSKPQRARIEYGKGREGWVLYHSLVTK